MADVPFGLRAVTVDQGTAPKIQNLKVAGSTAIFEGEIVAFNASGLVTGYTSTLAVAGDLIGVAVHAVASAAAADSRQVGVYTDPNQEFVVQASTGTITDNDLVRGRLYTLVNPASGTAATGQSIAELDSTSGTSVLGTNVSLIRPLQIIRPLRLVGEPQETLYSDYVVRISPPCHLFSHNAGNVLTAPFKGR